MWVVDFGGLKLVKEFLCNSFDHKLIVARDDPEFERLMKLHGYGHGDMYYNQIADVLVTDHVGCESFAKTIYEYVDKFMITYYPSAPGRVLLRSVEVSEHEGNSAIYERVD
jgi:6-pyruvoyltetrahydropterin/6-carboxytetrahydropterin synthase